MTRVPRVNAKQMAAVLCKIGFKLVRHSGSHAIYRNDMGVRATIPVHGAAILHPKIVKAILRDAEIAEDELRELL